MPLTMAPLPKERAMTKVENKSQVVKKELSQEAKQVLDYFSSVYISCNVHAPYLLLPHTWADDYHQKTYSTKNSCTTWIHIVIKELIDNGYKIESQKKGDYIGDLKIFFQKKEIFLVQREAV